MSASSSHISIDDQIKMVKATLDAIKKRKNDLQEAKLEATKQLDQAEMNLSTYIAAQMAQRDKLLAASDDAMLDDVDSDDETGEKEFQKKYDDFKNQLSQVEVDEQKAQSDYRDKTKELLQLKNQRGAEKLKGLKRPLENEIDSTNIVANTLANFAHLANDMITVVPDESEKQAEKKSKLTHVIETNPNTDTVMKDTADSGNNSASGMITTAVPNGYSVIDLSEFNLPASSIASTVWTSTALNSATALAVAIPTPSYSDQSLYPYPKPNTFLDSSSPAVATSSSVPSQYHYPNTFVDSSAPTSVSSSVASAYFSYPNTSLDSTTPAAASSSVASLYPCPLPSVKLDNEKSYMFGKTFYSKSINEMTHDIARKLRDHRLLHKEDLDKLFMFYKQYHHGNYDRAADMLSQYLQNLVTYCELLIRKNSRMESSYLDIVEKLLDHPMFIYRKESQHGPVIHFWRSLDGSEISSAISELKCSSILNKYLKRLILEFGGVKTEGFQSFLYQTHRGFSFLNNLCHSGVLDNVEDYIAIAEKSFGGKKSPGFEKFLLRAHDPISSAISGRNPAVLRKLLITAIGVFGRSSDPDYKVFIEGVNSPSGHSFLFSLAKSASAGKNKEMCRQMAEVLVEFGADPNLVFHGLTPKLVAPQDWNEIFFDVQTRKSTSAKYLQFNLDENVEPKLDAAASSSSSTAVQKKPAIKKYPQASIKNANVDDGQLEAMQQIFHNLINNPSLELTPNLRRDVAHLIAYYYMNPSQGLNQYWEEGNRIPWAALSEPFSEFSLSTHKNLVADEARDEMKSSLLNAIQYKLSPSSQFRGGLFSFDETQSDLGKLNALIQDHIVELAMLSLKNYGLILNGLVDFLFHKFEKHPKIAQALLNAEEEIQAAVNSPQPNRR